MQLIRQAEDGFFKVLDEQEKLFKCWFEEYKNLIFRVAGTYTDSPADRDDLFQEILLQLWRSIPNFRGNARETTWIYRVSLNTALVWKRGQAKKRKIHFSLNADTAEASAAKESDGEQVSNKQIIEQLYNAIRQLAKMDSSIVLMSLDGLSYDEMAEILGISQNNIGVRLNRAKKQLAHLLKGFVNDL